MPDRGADSNAQRFDRWRRINFGDRRTPRVLDIVQHAAGKIQDTP